MRNDNTKHLMNHIVEGELVQLYFNGELISNECYAEEETAPVGYEGGYDWYTFSEGSNEFRVSVASNTIAHITCNHDDKWQISILRTRHQTKQT